MPIYAMRGPHTVAPINIVIEAKSETAARLHLTKDTTAKVIGAKELADLVMAGVKVERAGAESEAAEASLRG